MGLAIDTVAVDVANPGATFTAAAVVATNNDSLTVRNYPSQNQAYMVDVIRRHNTSGAVRVLSPLLHDNVTGMTWYTNETPSLLEIPPFVGQRIEPGDLLSVQVTGDTTHHCSVYLVNYYTNLTGASANLYQTADLSASIKTLKPITIAVTASATVGLWSDTLITATENQLHATSFYAVLGFSTDTALGAIGFKAQSTGNLRICGPGATTPEDTSYYFIKKANDWGQPYIPVFNGQDRGACYVSVADNAASTTANVTLVLAELNGSNWVRSS
jgi:hypothetical protein